MPIIIINKIINYLLTNNRSYRNIFTEDLCDLSIVEYFVFIFFISNGIKEKNKYKLNMWLRSAMHIILIISQIHNIIISNISSCLGILYCSFLSFISFRNN